MSSHHPSMELLKGFAAGDLDGSVAAVVSAHVEHCSVCRKSVENLEQTLSSQAFDVTPEVSAADEEDAWKNVFSRLGSGEASVSGPRGKALNEIQVQGEKFVLPRALNQWVSRPLKWMPFGEGGRICQLGKEKGKSLFLIYLASQQQVPTHSHGGKEHSYVISGSYSADGATFETGDFSFSGEDVVHTPQAGSEDGCLLLSSVENRLNFFQGWLKPFNRLLWWFLSQRVKGRE